MDHKQIIEQTFVDSENDYLTVLAIAVRAREIAEDFHAYEEQLENEKATAIALTEFLAKDFEFKYKK